MKTILQLVLIDETGDSYYRMRWPGSALSIQDKNLSVINLDARAEERFQYAYDADLLVLFQSNDLDIVPIINQRKKQGKHTIVEYNDNFYEPPPSSPVYGPWSSPQVWQTYETIMKHGDHLIVTGEGLKNLFSTKVSCPISILENHIFELENDFETCWDKSDEFRIGWAGSVGHMADLLAILPTLEKFCLKHDKAKLYLMGNENIPSFVNLPKDKLVFYPWGTMHEYYDFLKKIHIGIAPLSDSAYNHCRSDIKAIEYGSRGVYPVIQNLTPYKKILGSKFFKGFDSFCELESILENLYQDKNQLQIKTKDIFDYIKNQRNAKTNLDRLNLYQSLLPKNSSKSASSLFKVGYHEIFGSPKTELECFKIVLDVQEIIKNKEYNKAIEKLKLHKELFDYEPSALILLAEATKHTNVEEATEILISGIEKFSLDLRYRLQLIKLKKEHDEILGQWIMLADFLERQSKHYKNFYEKMIISFYTTELKKHPFLLRVGEKLVNIYSYSYELLFEVGNSAFRQKEYSKSFSLLSKAEAIFLIKSKDNSNCKPEDGQFLLTLKEAADYAQRM